MRILSAAIIGALVIAAPAMANNPNQCRDAKGKFTKCPPKVAAVASGATKDKNGKCHVASGPKKGQFTKCP